MDSAMPPKPPMRRQRKTHKKSRLGCANCKVRSVKCDETKPDCKRCRSFGVACIYGSKSSPDTLNTESSFRVSLSTPSVKQPLAAPLPRVGNTQDSLGTYQLTHRDVGFVEKWLYRTVQTIGPRSSRPRLAAESLPFALSQPCVMHAMLALAEIHELSLSTPTALPARRSTSLETHWHLAVTGFRRQIGGPVPEGKRRTLWMAACLLSIAATANIETRVPESAWPLREPSSTDLSWLGMCEGKKTINDFSGPTQDSHRYEGTASLALNYLPDGFYNLFRLDDNNETNPYYIPVMSFAELIRSDMDIDDISPYTTFICNLGRDFRDLLAQKDERAMLVLLYWYAKACDPRLWWLWNRAVTEGLAICEYIQRSSLSQPEMVSLLAWPQSILHSAVADQGRSLLTEPGYQVST